MPEYFLRNPKSADFMTTSMLDFDLKHPSSWHVLTGCLRGLEANLDEFISQII